MQRHPSLKNDGCLCTFHFCAYLPVSESFALVFGGIDGEGEPDIGASIVEVASDGNAVAAVVAVASRSSVDFT